MDRQTDRQTDQKLTTDRQTEGQTDRHRPTGRCEFGTIFHINSFLLEMAFIFVLFLNRIQPDKCFLELPLIDWMIDWLIDPLICLSSGWRDVKFKETNHSAVMLNCKKVQQSSVQLFFPLSTHLRRRFQLFQRMSGSELEPFFPIWCVIVLVRGNELKNMCVCVFLGSSPVGHDVLWCHHILGMLRSLLLFFSAPPPPGAAQ